MALKLPPIQAPKPLLVAIPVVAGLGVLLFLGLQVQQLKDRLQQGQQKIEELSVRNQDLTQRLETLQVERKDLDARVTSLGKQLASASSELEQTRTGFQELQSRFERMSEEKSSLQFRVAALMEERTLNQVKLERLEQEKLELERSVIRLRERLTFLDRDYQKIATQLAELERGPTVDPDAVSVFGRDLSAQIVSTPTIATAVAAPSQKPTASGTVELPPIIVRKDQAGTTLPVRGQLVEVNEPHRFVVVDKGSTDGVRVGMNFDIIRGAGTVIGQATAVRVRPQLAACDVVRSQTSEPLRVGDTVVQRSP
jgi:hypothetical protein